MPAPSVTAACSALQAFLKDKCTKLSLSLSTDLPPYVSPPSSTSSSSSSSSQPSREILALTYDILYNVAEEVMLVEGGVKRSVDQAATYMRKLAQVWNGTRDVAAWLEGDACQFWLSSFPPNVLAVPWGEMEGKLREWVKTIEKNKKIEGGGEGKGEGKEEGKGAIEGVLWPGPSSSLSSSLSFSLSSSLNLSLRSSFSNLSPTSSATPPPLPLPTPTAAPPIQPTSSLSSSPSSSSTKTSFLRSLQFRLESSMTGYVTVQSLALFVYKSTLWDSLVTFCAEDAWTAPTKDVIVTVGFPKDKDKDTLLGSLKAHGFTVHNLGNWMDFKMWLFSQKDIRAMMKSEPSTAEFIVNYSLHPATTTLGEEVVRFLRARRLFSPVTIVGVSNSMIFHNYDELFLAQDLEHVWSINRYHRYEFKNLAENSAKFLKQAPRHHRTDLVDTFPYKNINLPALPPITCHLDWMRILILEDNSLEHLPVSIGNLSCLFRLTLTSNKLQSIPASIALLSQLRELYLNKNNFSSFPTHVCKLVGLKVLNIANNPLTSLPPSFSTLSSLLDLDIHSTLVNQLPNTMGDMANLQTLHVDKDGFQSYPRSFSEGSTADKLRFLKGLQPGFRPGCQQIIMLGKEGYSGILKNVAVSSRKIISGGGGGGGVTVTEMDMKHENTLLSFTLWDCTGRDIGIEFAFFSPQAVYIIVENDPQLRTVQRYKPAIKYGAKTETPFTIALCTFSASEQNGMSGCSKEIFLGDEEKIESLLSIIPQISNPKLEAPEIPFSYYMFTKFIQEQAKMFMTWKEVQNHVKHYTSDPFALQFLVKYGYLFFHGEAMDFQPKSDNAVVVLLPALNFVAQIKTNLKGFERVTRPNLQSKLTKICGESSDFQSIINLLKDYTLLHSIDEETFFFVPFIQAYDPSIPFEQSENTINLVRRYTSDVDCFSIDWFLNLITGIRSTLVEGQVVLGSIDSHSCVITIDIPETPLALISPPSTPSPSLSSSSDSLKSPQSPQSPPDSHPKEKDSKFGTLRASTTSRLSNLISFQRFSSSNSLPTTSTSPPSTPPAASHPPPVTTSSPQRPSTPSTSPPSTPTNPPLIIPTLRFKCYLHRSPSSPSLCIVLSSPSLSPRALSLFLSILHNVQFLLHHWIKDLNYTLKSACYKCFDFAEFARTHQAPCPIAINECISAARGISPLKCQNETCKQEISVMYVAPDLTIDIQPPQLERPFDKAIDLPKEEFARGAYGAIYKRTVNKTEEVIKVCLREDEEEQFLREMVLTSKLQSKYTITSVGYSLKPTLGLLLEYAPHGSLHSVLSTPSATPLSSPLIIRIAFELASAMRFIHDKGVVLRDLKSLNILVMSMNLADKTALVKVTDFGTAEYHMGFSAKYDRYCTSTYQTPESFSSNPVDLVLADIYCYGLVLWELMAMKTIENHMKEQKVKNGKDAEPKDRHLLFSAAALPASCSSHPLLSILTYCLQEMPKRRIQSFTEIEASTQKIKDG